MEGRARAPAAGTILNALANKKGSAFAINRYTTATVTLSDAETVTGTINDDPDADPRLIERCVELVLEEFDTESGADVKTTSEIPIASGLKSSSAAANAVILATLSALDIDVSEDGDISPLAATRIGVQAARDTNVTVTGAFDDATASMLGGVTVTDNVEDELLHREEVEWNVLVWTPSVQAYSADADLGRCERLAPIADFIAETVLAGQYTEAMTINGFVFCAALGYSTEPILEALPAAEGVSLSGTGPSMTAIGTPDDLAGIETSWSQRQGTLWRTTTQNTGAEIL